MKSIVHTWSNSSSINSRGGSVRNCGCSNDGEHAEHAKEKVDGHGSYKLHDFDDVGVRVEGCLVARGLNVAW